MNIFESMLKPKITPNQIQDFLGIQVYLVGGAVRDILLGKTPKDYDFGTSASPEQIENAITNAGRKTYCVGKKFGTIGFKYKLDDEVGSEYVEITTFRTEKYEPNNRRPTVEFTNDLKEDMSRRDFTINAMAMGNGGEIIDYFNGQQDLQNGVIKCVDNPKQRFKEDPLRILRAVRFATKYGFEIESETMRYCSKMNFRLLDISKERWVMELDKILSSDNVKVGLDLLMDLGSFKVMIPVLELQKNYQQNSPWHDFTLWEHTKNVVANIPKENLDLRWTALLHDIAKPFTRTQNPKGHSNYINHDILGSEMALGICQYLKFSKVRTNYITTQIKNHLSPDSDLKIYDDMGKKTSPSVENNNSTLINPE